MNTTPNLDNWVGLDGVRSDANHSLRADRRLTPGEAVKRNMRCTCGKDFGLLYDNAAKIAYRAHRKESN
jgi:hypothetical protein